MGAPIAYSCAEEAGATFLISLQSNEFSIR